METPAVHPRLLDPDVVAELAAVWRRSGRLRIDPILRPGLAAELASLLRRLPLTAHSDSGQKELSWRCSVGMPAAIDPQYPECMFALARFIDRDLPALARSITGYPLAAGEPTWLHLRAFRKGSYLDVAAKADLPAAWLGLTGASWPESWGGHLENVADDDDGGGDPTPPKCDVLDLFVGSSVRVPLILRHVEALWVHCPLQYTSEDL
jgi:hypothetical protein